MARGDNREMTENEQVESSMQFNPQAYLDGVIGSASRLNASDIHIRLGRPVTVRVDGRVRQTSGSPELTEENLENLVLSLMSPTQKESYLENNQVDLAASDRDGNRVRVNVYKAMGQISMVMRLIAKDIPTTDELGLPGEVSLISDYEQGLVILSGATGSGKSTTMAALLNEINKHRQRHILTIEDPVEYLFTEDKCMISQRQVGIDVPDFALAMKAALREDPDVILLGEMRDPESIDIALTAAETGHLVFSTLHAPTAADAVTRMVSTFEGEAQSTIRAKLAQNLRAIVTQRLVPRHKGSGRVAACEVMTVTARIRELILDPIRIKEIADLVKGGEIVEGMLHFDEHLKILVEEGSISRAHALQYATSPTDLSLKLQGFE
jgi:twitching motility protein PilT